MGDPSDLLDMDDEWVTDLNKPTGMNFLPDGRLMVTEVGGTLKVVNPDGSVDTAGQVQVSNAFQEKGLLNVLAHPDYANNHLIYLYYTGAGSGGGNDDNRVVTMELSEDNVLDTSTEVRLVEGIYAPLNHDGGGLATDGQYLYIGTGDSGSNTNAEPDQMQVGNYYATCFTNLNGKVLRLNLDGSIPQDNPLVGQTVDACGSSPGMAPSTTSTSPREEIFAWGFRNAFRLWVDPMTNNIWVGHVGEVTYEMVNVVPPTGNEHFGWPFREGNEGYPASRCEDVTPNVGACQDAVYRCESSQGNPGTADYNPDVPDQCDCMIGGLILTGCEWPDSLEGRYVFGDFTNERIWTLQLNDTRDNVIAERVDFMTPQGGGPTAFAERDGALYALIYGGSSHIARITPKTPDPSCDGGPGPSGGGGNGSGGNMSMAGGMSSMAGSGQGGGPAATNGGSGPSAGGASNPSGGGPSAPTPGGGSGNPGNPSPNVPANGGAAGPGTPSGGPSPTTGGSSTPGTQPSPGSAGAGAPGPAAAAGGGPSPAGNDGSGTAGAGGAAVSSDASSGDDGGCGCRMVESRSVGGSLLLLLAGLGAFFTRRRRR